MPSSSSNLARADPDCGASLRHLSLPPNVKESVSSSTQLRSSSLPMVYAPPAQPPDAHSASLLPPGRHSNRSGGDAAPSSSRFPLLPPALPPSHPSLYTKVQLCVPRLSLLGNQPAAP